MKTSQTLACNPTVAALLKYVTWNLKKIFKKQLLVLLTVILMWISGSFPEVNRFTGKQTTCVYDIV